MKRVMFDILVCASLFLFPWWAGALLALAGIFLFVQYYEFLAVGMVIYSLYIIPEHAFITKPIWFAVTLSIVYIGIQTLRQYLILYKK